MKTRITVAWAITVEIEVDPTKVNSQIYLEEVRHEAEKVARENLDLSDGMVTDCEEFPQLLE